MVKRSKHYRRKFVPGTPPGTLTADHDASPTNIQIMAYGPDSFTEAVLTSVDEIRDYLGKWPNLWINVDGLSNVPAISAIGQMFNLHPLALEDTLNLHQRPKMEDYGDHLFAVCQMVNNSDCSELDFEQVSIFMGKGFVISFQERAGDCWNPIRERIRRGAGKRLRLTGSDYLLYALLDSTIDNFFPAMENFGDHLDSLEDMALGKPGKEVMAQIQNTKRTLYGIRRAVWPLREALTQIAAHEDLMTAETRVFMRDCQDHIIQLLDIIESYRERSSGLVDIYLSSLSNRMNEVMKVLAIITTIFMPLTFIAGIYGMNFENMPELHAKNGYYIIMSAMGVIAVLMIIAFRRIGWLGSIEKS
ncbi:MAG: corA [Micavibrio sp.]|nr:corA [Micavibrio sp.]